MGKFVTLASTIGFLDLALAKRSHAEEPAPTLVAIGSSETNESVHLVTEKSDFIE